LQARCGKDAAEFFESFKKQDPSAVSFTNHYNPDLNGCFVLVNKTRFETGKGVTWVEWDLWDVNENRQVDVLGFGPNREELRTSAKGWPPGTPEPSLDACLTGNFIRCGDRDEYARRFEEVVLRFMQRSTPWVSGIHLIGLFARSFSRTAVMRQAAARGWDTGASLRIASRLPKSRLPSLPKRPFDNREWNNRSEQILLSRQQQRHPRGDDRERITRARQAAEALFTAKPPVSEPSVSDSALSDQAARKPRVLRIVSPAAPIRHEQLETPVSREPQTPRQIPRSQFGRIRTLVKYGMTVSQVAEA
jgi:hypothetical protein